MSKKIYISPSNQQGNVYATGNTNEKVQCHKIARACVAYLKKKGFNVKCTYNDDMYKRVSESNAFGADMHIAIHTNATVKHNVTGGTQILLYSVDGERKKAGQAVFDRLAPVTPGKSAERLVAMPGFYECKAANGLTVYVEAEFHDTKEGSDFIINNTSEIGEAIAQGVCDYYGVKVDKSENNKINAPAQGGTLYVVQSGAFRDKKNAQSYLSNLRKSGFDGFITKKSDNS